MKERWKYEQLVASEVCFLLICFNNSCLSHHQIVICFCIGFYIRQPKLPCHIGPFCILFYYCACHICPFFKQYILLGVPFILLHQFCYNTASLSHRQTLMIRISFWFVSDFIFANWVRLPCMSYIILIRPLAILSRQLPAFHTAGLQTMTTHC